MGRGVSGANAGRMLLTQLKTICLLLLVLPAFGFASFSTTLNEVKDSLLEREGLRSLASFLSIDPEDNEDAQDTSFSSSREPPKPIQKASSSSTINNGGGVIGPHWLVLK